MIEMAQAEVDKASELAGYIIDQPEAQIGGRGFLARAVLHLAERLTLQRECVMAYEFELSEFRKTTLVARQMHAPDELVAVVARLERERAEDRRRLAEAQTTIAKLREDRCATCRVKDRLGL